MAVKPPQNKALFDLDDEIQDKEPKRMGRPRGVSEAQLLFNTYVKANSSQLLDSALQQACEGDSSIMLFFLKKLIPASVSNRELLAITGDPAQQIQNILKWVIAGNADAAEGVQLTSIVEKSVMLKRMDELTGKLAAIETWMQHQTSGVIEGIIEHDEEKEFKP